MLPIRGITLTLGWLGSALCLSACSNPPLECASNVARALVADIAEKQNTSGDIDLPDLKVKVEYEYSLNDIRTEAEETKLQKAPCAATLHSARFVTVYKNNTQWFAKPNGTPFPLNERISTIEADHPITYKLEKASDGNLYATVYGLGGR